MLLSLPRWTVELPRVQEVLPTPVLTPSRERSRMRPQECDLLSRLRPGVASFGQAAWRELVWVRDLSERFAAPQPHSHTPAQGVGHEGLSGPGGRAAAFKQDDSDSPASW